MIPHRRLIGKEVVSTGVSLWRCILGLRRWRDYTTYDGDIAHVWDFISYMSQFSSRMSLTLVVNLLHFSFFFAFSSIWLANHSVRYHPEGTTKDQDTENESFVCLRLYVLYWTLSCMFTSFLNKDLSWPSIVYNELENFPFNTLPNWK